jgi:prevent-host-death family protein
MTMITLSVSEFKAKALGIIDRLSKNKEVVILTKRGKPIAKVVPYQETVETLEPGKLEGTIVEELDIVSPLGADMWSAAK